MIENIKDIFREILGHASVCLGAVRDDYDESLCSLLNIDNGCLVELSRCESTSVSLSNFSENECMSALDASFANICLADALSFVRAGEGRSYILLQLALKYILVSLQCISDRHPHGMVGAAALVGLLLENDEDIRKFETYRCSSTCTPEVEVFIRVLGLICSVRSLLGVVQKHSVPHALPSLLPLEEAFVILDIGSK